MQQGNTQGTLYNVSWAFGMFVFSFSSLFSITNLFLDTSHLFPNIHHHHPYFDNSQKHDDEGGQQWWGG